MHYFDAAWLNRGLKTSLSSAIYLQPISQCIAYCLLLIAYSLLLIAHCLCWVDTCGQILRPLQRVCSSVSSCLMAPSHSDPAWVRDHVPAPLMWTNRAWALSCTSWRALLKHTSSNGNGDHRTHAKALQIRVSYFGTANTAISVERALRSRSSLFHFHQHSCTYSIWDANFLS